MKTISNQVRGIGLNLLAEQRALRLGGRMNYETERIDRIALDAEPE